MTMPRLICVAGIAIKLQISVWKSIWIIVLRTTDGPPWAPNKPR